MKLARWLGIGGAVIVALLLLARFVVAQPGVTPNNLRTEGSALGASTMLRAFGLDTNISITCQPKAAGQCILVNPVISGFTAGSVIFAGASGALSQNNANFFWDNTNTVLGIGSQNVGPLLTAPGLVIGGATPVLQFTGGGAGGTVFDDAGPLTVVGTTTTLVQALGGNATIQSAGNQVVLLSGVAQLVLIQPNNAAGSTYAFSNTAISPITVGTAPDLGTVTTNPFGSAFLNTSLSVVQGSLTGASTPFITHTATWNNGATVFVSELINITNTASAVASRFVEYQRASTLQFAVTSGATTTGLKIRTAQQTAPTCTTNCGAVPTVTGSDTAMLVTLGAGTANAFVIVFNGTWTTAAPACVVQNQTTAANLVAKALVSTTQITVTTAVGPTAGDVFSVICIGTA